MTNDADDDCTWELRSGEEAELGQVMPDWLAARLIRSLRHRRGWILRVRLDDRGERPRLPRNSRVNFRIRNENVGYSIISHTCPRYVRIRSQSAVGGLGFEKWFPAHRDRGGTRLCVSRLRQTDRTDANADDYGNAAKSTESRRGTDGNSRVFRAPSDGVTVYGGAKNGGDALSVVTGFGNHRSAFSRLL